MKTYLLDIIPRIQRYSEKLDNLTLLTNQHWVVMDEIRDSKVTYIFRHNNELLISQNGRVEKAKWEYLGNNSLLIDMKEESYLFKHGFFDENILALKIDSKNEYAILVNENKYDGELNSIQQISDFLEYFYIELPESKAKEEKENEYTQPLNETKTRSSYKTDKGLIEFDMDSTYNYPRIGDRVYQNGKMAKDGKYRLSFLYYIHIKDGVLVRDSFA